MWHAGIDLHRQTLVIASVDRGSNARLRGRIDCRGRAAILDAMASLQPFQAVIEATGTYHWLFDLLTLLGSVLLAHPLRQRAMAQHHCENDKRDSQLLANLLRINQIPLAYIPPASNQQLRDLTLHRARAKRDRPASDIARGLFVRRRNYQAFSCV